MQRRRRTARIRHLAFVVTVAMLALPIQTSAASAVASTPLAISSTSLKQDGRQLVWSISAPHPFYPAALTRHRRTVCLLLHQGTGPPGDHLVCLAGHRPGKHRPRLFYRLANGKTRAISASFTRSSTSRLTARFLPDAVGIKYRRLHWRVISSVRPSGCPAPTGNSPSTCEKVLKTQRLRLRLHTPRAVTCIATGAPFVKSGPSNRPEIALTFDDGPGNTPPTMDFVNLLHRMNVPATFFEIGRQISTYDPTGAIERKMLAYGDMIANHTWSHPSMPSLSAGAQSSQLSMTQQAIRHATGFTPCLFRAPGGGVNSTVISVARSLGLTTVGWDIDPRDWSLPGTEAIYENVVSNAHNGAIVVEHFGGGPRYQTLAALPEEIKTLRARGYRFVTVTQLLGYKVIYK